ncbi:SURF1 family protein [Methylobacterium sp. JK268]
MDAAAEPGSAASRWRSLVAPGLATLVCLAILLSLGTWQVERKAWKEGLIRQITERAAIDPPREPPAPGAWDPAADEFTRVRASGRFLNDRETLVHGLAPGDVPGRALQGYYVLTPLVRDGAPTILVNRGFVPTELKNPRDRQAGEPEGEVTVTGILRASEARGLFVPAPDPAKGEWFNRDIPGIAASRGLGDVTPYLIEADATPNPGGWPRGGQLRVDLPNNHLQYAFTWYGIALCLVGVFGAYAWSAVRRS